MKKDDIDPAIQREPMQERDEGNSQAGGKERIEKQVKRNWHKRFEEAKWEVPKKS